MVVGVGVVVSFRHARAIVSFGFVEVCGVVCVCVCVCVRHLLVSNVRSVG